MNDQNLDYTTYAFPLPMVLNSDFLLPHLKERMRHGSRDGSRHILCPVCDTRTKLYRLADGRRKCQACGKKFDTQRQSDLRKLKQYADALLCFALDFPAQQATNVTGYRYRLILDLYTKMRETLAEQNLMPGKIRLLVTTERCNRAVNDSAFCIRCKDQSSCRGRPAGSAPVFGVKMLVNGQVYIDPLPDVGADFSEVADRRFAGYSGFICQGSFRRFADRERPRDGVEQLWSWMDERLKKHHGVWKRNVGFYLKELEWKYNHRLLEPEVQARKLAELLPADFLSANHAAQVQETT